MKAGNVKRVDTNKRLAAIGIVCGLMAVFIAGMNLLDGNRTAQGFIAGAYVVAVVVVMRWGNRRRA